MLTVLCERLADEAAATENHQVDAAAGERVLTTLAAHLDELGRRYQEPARYDDARICRRLAATVRQHPEEWGAMLTFVLAAMEIPAIQ